MRYLTLGVIGGHQLTGIELDDGPAADTLNLIRTAMNAEQPVGHLFLTPEPGLETVISLRDIVFAELSEHSAK